MNERDQRAVEAMASSGMDLETLQSCFPAFDRAELEKIYRKVKQQKEDGGDGAGLSINCS